MANSPTDHLVAAFTAAIGQPNQATWLPCIIGNKHPSPRDEVNEITQKRLPRPAPKMDITLAGLVS